MAEAVGFGASILTFVGLAGNILQGCIFIRTLLDDLKDAPADIQVLNSELAAFQASLDSFRARLAIENRTDDDVRLALEYSDEAIKALQMTVQKLRKSNGKWYHSIRSVVRKDSVMKHVRTLERARSLVVTSQLNMAISVGQNNIIESKAVTRAVTNFLDRGRPRSTNRSQTTPVSEQRCTIESSQFAFREKSNIQVLAMQQRMSNVLSSPVDPARASNYWDDSAEDDGIKFGDTTGIHPTMIEMAKDTIRGALVDYYLQKAVPSFLPSNPSNSFDIALAGPSSHLNSKRRKISHRKTEQHFFQRSLGLVTISTTTIKSRSLSAWESQNYVESTNTKTVVRLDPNPAFLRVRLFCTTILPHYHSGFDPILRVSNRISHNSPIVKACRNGDIRSIQLQFAAGSASPFDLSASVVEQSLLQIVFKQILLYMNQSAEDAPNMAALCQVFKFLVDQGLDPGQLGVQHRPLKWHAGSTTSTYILKCSHCFTPIFGAYYDCSICANGDYTLCKNCLTDGRRCLNEQHHRDQPLKHVANSGTRVMKIHSAIDSLASLESSPEFEPHLVSVARTIIHRSVEDPFLHATFDEMLWYRQVLGIESPVCPLILGQEEWEMGWDRDKTPSAPRTGILIGNRNYMRRDPKGLVLQAWLDSNAFDNQEAKWKALAWSISQSQIPKNDNNFKETIINHIVTCAEKDPSAIRYHIIPALVPVLQKHDRIGWLKEALQRIGYRGSVDHLLVDLSDDDIEREIYTSMVTQLAFLESKDFFQAGELRYQQSDPAEWGYFKYYVYHRQGRCSRIMPYGSCREFPEYIIPNWPREGTENLWRRQKVL